MLDAFSGENSSVIYVTDNNQILSFLKTARESYAKLTDNVYEALLFQTRLQPYLNEIGLTIENDEFKLDYSGVMAKFGEIHAANPEKAFVDLGEFIAYSKDGSNGIKELSSLFAQYVQTAVGQGTFEQYAEQLGSKVLAKLGHQIGTDADETLRGNDVANFLLGGNGNDTLDGRQGNDILSGGEGDDELHGGSGSDTLIGGAGNDKLYGGNSEADTYVFAKGHGQDVVSDSGYKTEHTDALRFEGAKAADIRLGRTINDLLVYAYGNSEDSVAIGNYFQGSHYRYFDLAFDDETLSQDKIVTLMAGLSSTQSGTERNDTIHGIGSADILNGGLGNDSLYGYGGDDVLSGNEGNDYLYGGEGNDIVNGDEGNDYLYGETGNDTLNGGEGNDRLYGSDGLDKLSGGSGNDYLDGGINNDILDGGEGDDELHGGSGSDTLIGGAGNDKLYGGGSEADTYVFAKGHGQDIVSDSGYSDIHIDTLVFKEALLEHAVFSREGNNLIIQAYGGEDKVDVQSYFSSSYYRYNQFTFEDATVKVDASMNVSVI